MLDNTLSQSLFLKIEHKVAQSEMKDMLKFIRRRIIRKRLAVLWVGLVAIELFCPALCEIGPTGAPLPGQSVASAATLADKSEEGRTSISNCENDGDQEPVGDCNDECLCHAVAIPSIVGDVASSPIDRTSIPLKNGFPIFNSLPPPYIPPKFS